MTPRKPPVHRILGTVVLATALACGAAAGPRLRPAAADPPAPKDLPAAEQELQRRINAAIDGGVARLRATQRPDGSWPGEFGSAGQTGLAMFTLLGSGVPKDDAAVTAAARWLERLDVARGTTQDVMADRPPALRMTYDHALLVLALVTHDPVAHRKAIRRSVQEIVAAQKPSGQWAYLVSMGGPLDAGDNSNTQFAILALRHAAEAGFAVPRSVWERAYRHFDSTPGADGGWGYGCVGTMEGSYGSMTAVGIASLVICKAMLLGPSAAPAFHYLEVPSIAGGLKWLVRAYAVDRNPRISEVTAPGPATGAPRGPPGGPPPGGPPMATPSDGTFQYYWLYALERVGMLLGLKYVGLHEWYRDGAEWLLAHQEADGGWRNPAGTMGAPEPPLAATCFAILFLRRATLPVVTAPDRPR